MKAVQLLIKSLIGTFFFLFILFVSAGRISYWQGWLYASISLLCVFLNSLVLNNNRDLAEERSKMKAGTKSWDKKILGLSALFLMSAYVIAGLDAGRYHWSPDFIWNVNASGVMLILIGEIIFLTAQKQNNFFSSVVRIQTDRAHTVCDTGIYKIVRHPGYFGMMVTAIGIPLTLGSLWSFIPCFFSIFLTILRTSLEDKTLVQELKGYREYTFRTPYKLVPYIW